LTVINVNKFLSDNGQTLATAESLTGGAIAAKFVGQPGVSGLFKGGVVAYQEEAKILMLEVSAKSIDIHGVVSQQVASEMARGARAAFGSDWAVSTTGIAGPTGGTEEDPIGTVCFGVARPDGTVITDMVRFGNIGRAKISAAAVKYAIQLLKEHMWGKAKQ